VPTRSSPRWFPVVVAAGAGSATACSVQRFLGSVNGTREGSRLEAQLMQPMGIAALDSGSSSPLVVVSESGTNRIRTVALAPTASVSTVAGDGVAGMADGAAMSARFNKPEGLASSPTQARLYIADGGNNRIRTLKDGVGVC
jgi:hypothetical protein